MLVGLFWLAVDYGTEYAAPLLPYSLQVKLGESVFDELTADKDECHGKAGLKALNDLANRLAKAADYPHEIAVHVMEGGPVNAFTLPGGILVFYSDLIEQAKDGAQVAGVMAHEIGHVVHYHPMKGLVRQYGIELLVKLVSGGYSDLLSTLASGGNVLLALRNGRGLRARRRCHRRGPPGEARDPRRRHRELLRADAGQGAQGLGRHRRHLVEPSADHRAHRRHAASIVRHAALHRCRMEGGAQCLQVTARRCRCAGRSRTTSGW